MLYRLLTIRNLITILLLCVCCRLAAQPGPRELRLNLNDYRPTINDAREAHYGVVQYYFVIDSTTNLSKLANLRGFHSLNLVIGLKALPPEIRLLSDSLRQLDLYGDNRFTDISSLRSLGHLTDLTFHSFNHEVFPDLGGIPNLQSVTIFGGKIKNIQGLSASKSLKNVRLNGMNSLTTIDLKLNGIDSLLIEDLPALNNIEGILNCRQLKRLSLYRCDALKDISVIARSKSLKSLTVFGLDQLNGLNFDMGKMNLEEMNISSCEGMRDISGIATCKALKKLTLAYVSKYIRNLNFDMSAMSLTDLKIAGDYYYWTPINDVSGITSCHTLRLLDLSQLDSLKVVDFKDKPTGLQILMIKDCKSLETISGLSNCKSLSLLAIIENPRLTKIPNLKSEIPFVKGIMIQKNYSLKIPDYFGNITQGQEWYIFENGK